MRLEQGARAEYASANRSLREGGVYRRMATGGSGAVRRSREYLQQAGASARARLIAAAAEQWGVPAAECRAEQGRVHHDGSGRSVNYGAIAGQAAKIELAAEPAIKTPDQFRLLGQPTKRLDTAPKVNGTRHLRHRHPAARHAVRVGADLPGLRRHAREL